MKELNRKIKVLKCLVVLILVFGFMKISYAQDVIIKNDNSTIECKVLKIGNSEIEYKKWTNLDGPTYVINILDVSNIKYQNGDVDDFLITSGIYLDTISSFMERSGSDLMLNGVLLSDSEVLDLLGEQGFDTYINARKQLNAGSVVACLFTFSLLGDIVGINGMVNGKDSQAVFRSVLLFYVSFIVTNVTGPLMCVSRGIGKGRLNWLVDDFNEKHNNSMSYSIAPSLMNCEMPQLQNNYGFGLTLKMNF